MYASFLSVLDRFVERDGEESLYLPFLQPELYVAHVNSSFRIEHLKARTPLCVHGRVKSSFSYSAFQSASLGNKSILHSHILTRIRFERARRQIEGFYNV